MTMHVFMGIGSAGSASKDDEKLTASGIAANASTLASASVKVVSQGEGGNKAIGDLFSRYYGARIETGFNIWSAVADSASSATPATDAEVRFGTSCAYYNLLNLMTGPLGVIATGGSSLLKPALTSFVKDVQIKVDEEVAKLRPGDPIPEDLINQVEAIQFCKMLLVPDALSSFVTDAALGAVHQIPETISRLQRELQAGGESSQIERVGKMNRLAALSGFRALLDMQEKIVGRGVKLEQKVEKILPDLIRQMYLKDLQREAEQRELVARAGKAIVEGVRSLWQIYSDLQDAEREFDVKLGEGVKEALVEAFKSARNLKDNFVNVVFSKDAKGKQSTHPLIPEEVLDQVLPSWRASLEALCPTEKKREAQGVKRHTEADLSEVAPSGAGPTPPKLSRVGKKGTSVRKVISDNWLKKAKESFEKTSPIAPQVTFEQLCSDGRKGYESLMQKIKIELHGGALEVTMPLFRVGGSSFDRDSARLDALAHPAPIFSYTTSEKEGFYRIALEAYQQVFTDMVKQGGIFIDSPNFVYKPGEHRYRLVVHEVNDPLNPSQTEQIFLIVKGHKNKWGSCAVIGGTPGIAPYLGRGKNWVSDYCRNYFLGWWDKECRPVYQQKRATDHDNSLLHALSTAVKQTKWQEANTLLETFPAHLKAVGWVQDAEVSILYETGQTDKLRTLLDTRIDKEGKREFRYLLARAAISDPSVAKDRFAECEQQAQSDAEKKVIAEVREVFFAPPEEAEEKNEEVAPSSKKWKGKQVVKIESKEAGDSAGAAAELPRLSLATWKNALVSRAWNLIAEGDSASSPEERMAKRNEAIKYLETVSLSDEKDGTAPLLMAHMYLVDNRMSEALASLKISEERDPNNPDLLYHFGMYYRLTKKGDKALSYFERAFVAIETPQGDVYNDIKNVLVAHADELLTKNKSDEAAAILRNVLEKDGKDYDANVRLSGIELTKDRFYQAREHLDRASAAAPDTAQVYLLESEYWNARGLAAQSDQWKAKLEALQVAQDPKNAGGQFYQTVKAVDDFLYRGYHSGIEPLQYLIYCASEGLENLIKDKTLEGKLEVATAKGLQGVLDGVNKELAELPLNVGYGAGVEIGSWGSRAATQYVLGEEWAEGIHGKARSAQEAASAVGIGVLSGGAKRIGYTAGKRFATTLVPGSEKYFPSLQVILTTYSVYQAVRYSPTWPDTAEHTAHIFLSLLLSAGIQAGAAAIGVPPPVSSVGAGAVTGFVDPWLQAGVHAVREQISPSKQNTHLSEEEKARATLLTYHLARRLYERPAFSRGAYLT